MSEQTVPGNAEIEKFRRRNRMHKIFKKKSLSYKNSREVVVIGSGEGAAAVTKVETKGVLKGKKMWRRGGKKSNPIRCPNAPHNTTSFLMNFHKSETKKRKPATAGIFDDDEDSIGRGVVAYGSFFQSKRKVASDVASVYSYSSR